MNLNSATNDVFTTEPSIGGVDIITGGDGDNILLGGALGDIITGGIGNDIVLGDNGRVSRNAANVVTRIETTDPDIGGEDTIEGDAGDDILLGGTASDDVRGGPTTTSFWATTGFSITRSTRIPRSISSRSPTRPSAMRISSLATTATTSSSAERGKISYRAAWGMTFSSAITAN